MSITFLLVRHGIKERAAGDVPITSEGKQQAYSTIFAQSAGNCCRNQSAAQSPRDS